MNEPSVDRIPLSASMQALAVRLAAARRERRQIMQLPPEEIPQSVELAYEVNREVERLLGWEPLGWKVAGTTQAVRERMGIATPIYGRSYRRFVQQSPGRFDLAELLDPLVESECFVTLRSPLAWRAEPWTQAEVRAAIGTVHAGIELAECRFPSANLPPLPAILADGSATGSYIYGPEIPDWRVRLAEIAVEVRLDGRVRRTGAGSEVMGDPLAPLLWLAETLRARGIGIAAGEMISTGSMTGMLPVREPCRIDASFGTGITVQLEFEDGGPA